jgi:hypothetical protein
LFFVGGYDSDRVKAYINYYVDGGYPAGTRYSNEVIDNADVISWNNWVLHSSVD